MTWCKGKQCATLQKRKSATYGIVGQKPVVCKTCIPLGIDMVNLVSKRCEKCSKQPTFGYAGKLARFCKDHKLENMVDIKHARCEKCSKRPCFGYTGETARFCKEHKLEDMLDIKHTSCEKCFKRPYFGYPGKSARFCDEHKIDDMVDIMSKRCEKCSKQSVYGYVGCSTRFCMKHREEGMVDVKNRICPGYDRPCPVRTYPRGHKYCMSCDPDDSRRKRFKRYENAFFDYVDGKIDIYQREFRVNFDSSETSKTYARIDGIIKQDDVVVCIEIDEDGHENYECEEHRMHLVNGELLQKYPGINIGWVRVNPNVEDDDQWSPKAINIRNKRFDDVIETIHDILMTKNTNIKYIGF
jgi:hypothetical protein